MVDELKQYIRFELTLMPWKGIVLAANTNTASNAPLEIRTPGTMIKSHVLYQLS